MNARGVAERRPRFTPTRSRNGVQKLHWAGKLHKFRFGHRPTTNGAKAGKAALRDFTFTKEVDAELVRLKQTTGKNMTAVLEDLLLQRRQFSAPVEAWLDAETRCTRKPRAEIIEAALLRTRNPLLMQ